MDGCSRRQIRSEHVVYRPVGKQAAEHDFPVSAVRCEDIQIGWILAEADEVPGGVAGLRDLSSWRNVIGRNVIAQHEDRVSDIRAEARLRTGGCEWRAADVG